ncbi:MAG: hypothetical protein AAF493_25255 [Pseudomonadota bacterium]
MTALTNAPDDRPPHQAPIDPSLRRSGPTVMRLERLGAFHPTRLSFARTLVRRMIRERWSIEPISWDLDDDGYGSAVLKISTPTTPLYFYAFSQSIAPEERTDRVIAERWDTTYALSTAPPSDRTRARLAREVPRQEAGRLEASEWVLSRANKSVRFFEHVVNALANREAPSDALLEDVGYLMRTTAVYGNGKFGLADFDVVRRSGLFALPFQAEMLTVYLVREFSVRLVEHIAARRAHRSSVSLPSPFARALGIGNATGLGMAPFLVTHPRLLHHWMNARETALARVRAVESITAQTLADARSLLDQTHHYVGAWQTDDQRQSDARAKLVTELERVRTDWFSDDALTNHQRPWDQLYIDIDQWASLETVELIVAFLLELHPTLVDDLEHTTAADEQWSYTPTMPVRELRALCETHYGWALALAFDEPKAEQQFWYVSAAKEEPRLGARFEEPGAEHELPIDIGRQVHRLYRATEPDDLRTVGELLQAQPALRGVVRRVQSLAGLEYAEIQANLLDADALPIHMLRCKLATFGANRFDPKSNLWTRITLFQNAPLAGELHRCDENAWALFGASKSITDDAGA